jgi:hypothetical protein
LPPSSNFRGSRGPARDSINQDHDIFSTHSIILEENEDLESSQYHHTPKSCVEPTPLNSSTTTIRRTLRRSNSHESLISIHGMDIHTLSSRPSQLLLGKYVATAAPSSSVSATVTDESALGTRASPPRLRPQNQSTRSASHSYLRDIAAQQGRALNRKSSRPSLPGRVSGWVWNKWSSGTSAPSSNQDNESVSSASSSLRGVNGRARQVSTSSTASVSNSTQPVAAGTSMVASTPIASLSPGRNVAVSPRKVQLRPPGVNQPGPIWGFPIEKKPDKNVVVKRLDVEALRDGLES